MSKPHKKGDSEPVRFTLAKRIGLLPVHLKLRSLSFILFFLVSLVGLDAWAEETTDTALTVEVSDYEGESLVTIRSAEGELPASKRAASRRGIMLVFPGKTVLSRRIPSKGKRLSHVQTAMSKHGAVVRIVQRKKQSGPIAANVDYFDSIPSELAIKVFDAKSLPPPVEQTTAADSKAVADTDKVPSSEDTLSALQKKLAPPSPTGDFPSATQNVAGDTAKASAVLKDTEGGKSSEPLDPQKETNTTPNEGAAQPREGKSEPTLLQDPEADENKPSWTRYWLTSIGLLLLVLAVGLLPFLLKRRFQGAKDDRSRMKVTERSVVGPKQQVVRLQLPDRDLLLGVTEHQVNLLVDLSVPTSASASVAKMQALASQLHAQADAASSPEVHENRVDEHAAERVIAFKNRLKSALNAPDGVSSPTPSAGEDHLGPLLERAELKSAQQNSKLSSQSQSNNPKQSQDPPWANEA